MKRIAKLLAVPAVALILALVMPVMSTPQPLSAEGSDIYALVQLPDGVVAEDLKETVDVFDATSKCRTRDCTERYAIIGCTQAQLDSLVAGGYTVVEQRTGDEDECLGYLYELRDTLAPPSPGHHTIIHTEDYDCIDSNERGGPIYNWWDISRTGTRLTEATVQWGMDDGWWWVDMGFPFTYYGRTYTQCAIGTNGQLWFHNRFLGLGNCHIPCNSGYGVNRFLAVFWDDLDPRARDCRIYYGTVRGPTGQMFVVQWTNIPHYRYTDKYAGNTATFQVILYQRSNNILMQYMDVDAGNPWEMWGGGATVGIQKNNRVGLLYSYDRPDIRNLLAILYTPGVYNRSPVITQQYGIYGPQYPPIYRQGRTSQPYQQYPSRYPYQYPYQYYYQR